MPCRCGRLLEPLAFSGGDPLALRRRGRRMLRGLRRERSGCPCSLLRRRRLGGHRLSACRLGGRQRSQRRHLLPCCRLLRHLKCGGRLSQWRPRRRLLEASEGIRQGRRKD